ncbi:MAG: hypothetical protein M8317_01010 [Nitrosopumilus sp.]|nr:hypothetical protein [Nitrosopumilus sp.]MDC4228534.1 hypothetical protein [Nitrosopumilus sp.]MDC4229698.1 hypothetical protein [Nitrosopumilus sp.]
MKKYGPIIAFVGFSLILISLLIAISSVPSDISEDETFLVSSLFEGMFDDVSETFQIMPGDVIYTSYTTSLSDVPLLWGIQIIDYQYGDMLYIQISNIFGDSYGEFVQNDSVLFTTTMIDQSDTLNFQIKNTGTRIIDTMVMFSEDPENSDAFSNPNSPMMDMLLSLIISGFLIILGIIILLIGIIVTILDLKNKLDNKRNY